jgi:hypothetical protein
MKFSGVLPFAYDDANCLHILVAREAFGHDQGLWSGFAGGLASAHESKLTAACRECFEESMGLLGTVDTLTEMLSHAPCVAVPDGVHYLLHIRYNDFLPHAFAGVRAMYARTARTPLPSYAPYVEKDAVLWLPLTRCSDAGVVTSSTGLEIRFRRGFAADLTLIHEAFRDAKLLR